MRQCSVTLLTPRSLALIEARHRAARSLGLGGSMSVMETLVDGRKQSALATEGVGVYLDGSGGCLVLMTPQTKIRQRES